MKCNDRFEEQLLSKRNPEEKTSWQGGRCSARRGPSGRRWHGRRPFGRESKCRRKEPRLGCNVDYMTRSREPHGACPIKDVCRLQQEGSANLIFSVCLVIACHLCLLIKRLRLMEPSLMDCISLKLPTVQHPAVVIEVSKGGLPCDSCSFLKNLYSLCSLRSTSTWKIT